jgi:hypothetical protein
MGNDRARRILILALLVTLAADALFPREGATAAVISASFWLYGLAIVGFTIHQLVLRVRHGSGIPVLKWALLSISVISLYVYAAFLERGTTVSLLFALTILGAPITLVVLAVRDALRGVRARRVATFPPHRG